MSVPELALQAQTQTQAGDYAGACATYVQLVELEPTMAAIHLNRGCAQVKAQQLDGALSSFEKRVRRSAPALDMPTAAN